MKMEEVSDMRDATQQKLNALWRAARSMVAQKPAGRHAVPTFDEDAAGGGASAREWSPRTTNSRVTPASLDTAAPPRRGNGAEWRDCMLSAAVKLMNLSQWFRQQWSLWGMLLSVAAAFLAPITPSALIINLSVAAIFFLIGCTSPLEELAKALRNLRPAAFTMCHSFVVGPLVALLIHALPIYDDTPKRIMLTGLMCTLCLPPSTTMSLVMSVASSGTETTALLLSALGNICGLVLTPLLVEIIIGIVAPAQAVLAATQSNSSAASAAAVVTLQPSAVTNLTMVRNPGAFVVPFLVTIILPFCAGQLAQALVTRWTAARRAAPLSVAAAPEHAASKGHQSVAAMCAETCDGIAHSEWRNRVRLVTFATMLFLNYAIFCNLFHQKSISSSPSITLASTALCAGLCVAAHTVLSLFGWFAGKVALPLLTPEDRIAVFFVGGLRSEVLAVPLLTTLFAQHTEAYVAALMVPSLVYHLVQCVVGGLLAHPLRSWRNQQHCRPGTTLLPSKYCRVPKHQLALTPGKE
jgi:sodium/bile acid cotransporter 7